MCGVLLTGGESIFLGGALILHRQGESKSTRCRKTHHDANAQELKSGDTVGLDERPIAMACLHGDTRTLSNRE